MSFVLAGYAPSIYVYCVFSSWQGQSSSRFLSRFQFQRFCHLVLQADLTLCVIPESLLVALQTTWPWGDSLCKDWHLPLVVFIPQLNVAKLTFAAKMVTLTGMAPSLLPMRRFMCFATLLADNLTHTSVKVYLSVVGSLHSDHGLLDPFINVLHLQHLLRGLRSSVTQTPPYHPGSSAGNSVWTGLL